MSTIFFKYLIVVSLLLALHGKFEKYLTFNGRKYGVVYTMEFDCCTEQITQP